MFRTLRRYGALVAVAGLGACEDQLVVTNPNSPETGRVIATPADAEALIASYYKRWHDGLYRTITNFHGMANVMSFQNYSSLANNCQNSRQPFTQPTNSNAPGNTCAGEQQRVYFVESEVSRVATTFLRQLDGLAGDSLNLGSTARNARARAFAEYLRGVSLGYLALLYDSAAIISVDMTPVDPGTLYAYTEVMDSAFASLQRAIDAASDATVTGTDGFPLPGTWIPGATSYSGGATGEFVKMVRSYRARFRANLARNPAERAAVNWTLVVADAQAGITADQLIATDPTTGPFNSWANQYDPPGLWHQMPPFVIGMADGAGNYYANWVATPVGSRGAGNVGFFMDSPDLRFPQGATRAAQNADFALASCEAAGATCKRYFVNRNSGGDQFAGAGWGASNYDWVRYHGWDAGIGGVANKGNIPFFTRSEIRMLEAEGQYRLGNFAAAAALADFSRTAGMSPTTPSVATGGGLPGLVANGVVDATTLVPGGAACVPKYPTGLLGPVGCGTLWEAIKYEKRIETAYTHFAAWYLDMRGWGDLGTDLPTFWAVPYQDLQARGYTAAKLYGAGVGTGNAPNSFAVAPTTYGW